VLQGRNALQRRKVPVVAAVSNNHVLTTWDDYPEWGLGKRLASQRNTQAYDGILKNSEY
jgi:hypothetical protein